MDNEPLAQNIDPELYRNRWIALVQGRVVGVGLTARQAHRAAKQTRPRDEPRLLFVDAEGRLTNPDNQTHSPKNSS